MRKFMFVFATAWILGTGPANADFKVLVFSKTADFRHASIPDGLALVQQLGATNGFQVDLTEDAANFNPTNLAQYAAVVFMMTSGDVLDTNQQAAFEGYIQNGGGWVGVHSATDTEGGWPWYGQLIGAFQTNHPNGTASATIKVCDRVHPSTRHLPERWVRTDEWYNFYPMNSQVHVLAWLDETSAAGYFASAPAQMGFDHPIVWCHEFEGGRAWYTALGHTSSTYQEPYFRDHLLGGILWAAGATPGDGGATVWSNYEKTILDSNALVEPLALDVAPDGRVFYIERVGRLNVFLPASATRVQNGISVNSATSDGLIGVALDPGFMTNNWIYLCYGPANTEDIRVSRFTMNTNTLNPASEQILLTVPIESDIANHISGDMEFGPDGCLYISFGDNSRFSGSPNNGYAPIDERAGQFRGDAQRTAANTMDLRGKILRVKPETNGTYSIPAGNLYPPGTPLTRPEIYAMGLRNPFRITVDPGTGWVYWGDVGPDASTDSATRGPRGYDEWNQARTPGFYGWPYGIANNKAYIDYDFNTGVSGSAFDLTNVINLSPNNTGLTNLPAAQSAWIWYPYGSVTDFPELGTSSDRCAMVGAVYQFDTNVVFSGKLPAYFDDTLFVIEFERNYIKEIKIDTNGNVLKINKFLPALSLLSPIDLKMGPDGSIYLIEYGNGWRAANTGGRLSRITYTAGNKSPVAVAGGTPSDGAVPLAVQFSSTGTTDPDDAVLTYAWDFDLDGTTDSTNANPMHTYTVASNYTARLTVTDFQGASGISDVFISAGNTRPMVAIQSPPHGSVADWGEFVRYNARVDDAEDGSSTNGGIDCTDVLVETALGHDEHAHAAETVTGCEGVFQMASDHSGTENIYFLMSAEYTDLGAAGVNPLKGGATAKLNPRHIETEFNSASSGVTTPNTSDPAGGVRDIASIDHGDYIMLTPIHLTNITGIKFRVGLAAAGSSIEMRVGGTNGTLIGTANVPATGNLFSTFAATVNDPGITHDLYFVFKRNPGDSNLFLLNWIEFEGNGVSIPLEPYLGTPAAIPGVLQAEDFDIGGADISSHDTTGGNSGGQYRFDTDTDIEACSDAGGGHNLTNVRGNEWLRYSVDVASAGFYTFGVRVASAGTGGVFRIEIDGQDATGPVALPDTGGTQTWATLNITNVPIFPGPHVLRLLMVSDGAGGAVGNFNYLAVSLAASNQAPIVSWVSPTNGTSVSAPAFLNLSASVADPDGVVTLVKFFNGTNELAELTEAPYNFSWENVPAGSYALTVRATDDLGFSSTSAVVNVQVTNRPWVGLDIGGATPAGSLAITNGRYTMTAGGADFWSATDSGFFAYRPITGNVEVIARVLNAPFTDPFSKAGVMIRESLNGDSKNYFMAATRDMGPTFQWRTNTAGDTYAHRPVVINPPLWVRMTRIGNIVTSYRSTNGTSWTFHRAITNPVASAIYVGLAATSHANGTAGTAVFTNVAIYTAPTIVTQPVSRIANAGAATQFFVVPGPESGPPLFYQWRRNNGNISGAVNSNYNISPVATNHAGNHTVVILNTLGSITSAVATLTVNLQPASALTNPLAGSIYGRPLDLPLMAAASDPDGTVTRVDFYRGVTLLGTSSNAPYAFVWSNAPGGSHLLSVKAFDNWGGSNSSASVSVTLTTPPPQIVAPARVGGQFQLTLQGIKGDSVRIEASTNFQNWTVLGTNTVGNEGSLLFMDPASTNYPHRFYRGRYLQ